MSGFYDPSLTKYIQVQPHPTRMPTLPPERPLKLCDIYNQAKDLGLFPDVSPTSRAPATGMPPGVSRLYMRCMAEIGKTGVKFADPELHCATVAWSVYCALVNPTHSYCDRYKQLWGDLYSEREDDY